ncbi:MAG: type II toxin-antitoxin system RelE/ParE family toxin [Planctomycetaceae bacterium]|nr:MAG: type II toxin-antitoxin system RelE/ParE family toxin [Planctomycetaceae bacterium]
MNRPIDFDVEARAEFEAASNWYAKQSPRAAVGFVAAVEHILQAIAEDPTRFPKTLAGCRRSSLRRYPYSIIYYCHAEDIVVVAVAHMKRRPGYCKHRK